MDREMGAVRGAGTADPAVHRGQTGTELEMAAALRRLGQDSGSTWAGCQPGLLL